MSDEARKLVSALRVVCGNQACIECPANDWCHGNKLNGVDDDAADMIETLILVIEQKDRELAGMSFLLTSAQSAAETYKRERDRYWNWIKGMGCETCSGDCGKCDGTSSWTWSGEDCNVKLQCR